MSDDYFSRAETRLKTAQELLLNTYPRVEEPKLLLAIVEDIYVGIESCMLAVLSERVNKHEKLPKDSGAFFEAFRKVSPDLGFDAADVDLITELSAIIHKHEESPVEFQRKDRFVICDEKYSCRELSLDGVKQLLSAAMGFLIKTRHVLEERN